MRLFELLKELLDDGGIPFEEQDDTIQFSVLCGGHRWQAAFAEDSESFLKYYARYPWAVPKEREADVLKTLNALNSTLRAGCFMIHKSFVLFRYGVYIFDEFTAKESMTDLLLSAVARTEAAWEDVYSAVERGKYDVKIKAE